jgi:hypothetical protein
MSAPAVLIRSATETPQVSNVATHEAAAAAAAAGTAIYYVPRRFDKVSISSTFYVRLFCTKVFEQLFSIYVLAL